MAAPHRGEYIIVNPNKQMAVPEPTAAYLFLSYPNPEPSDSLLQQVYDPCSRDRGLPCRLSPAATPHAAAHTAAVTASGLAASAPVARGSRKILAVDLDETLAQTHNLIIRFHNETFGSNNKPEDFVTYSYCKPWNCSPAECARRVGLFFSSEAWLPLIQPVPGARDALHRLKHCYAFTPVVVTSRPSSLADHTTRFLEEHFTGLFDYVVFTDGLVSRVGGPTGFQAAGESGASSAIDLLALLAEAETGSDVGPSESPKRVDVVRKKSDLCLRIGAVCLVDDSAHHVEDCMRAGVPVVLFDLDGSYPWAKDLSGHCAVAPPSVAHHWDDVERILLEFFTV